MPTKTVHVVPMLSPVLEDFVPPQFRGSIPDTPRTEAAAATVEAPPANWFAEKQLKAPVVSDDVVSEAAKEPLDHCTGIRSRVGLMLLHWRKRAQRGPVQVPQKKPVQVQGLRRQKSKKYPRSRRSVAHYLNPLCLFARLRDTYIHMMNTVATSGIVASGPMGDDSGTHGSTMFFSREFDAESIAQLVELERSSSKPDTEYRQNMAFARNLARVNNCGDNPFLFPANPRETLGGRDPVLPRSKTTRHDSGSYFSVAKSGSRLSGEPVLSRSKSNSLVDDVFFASKPKAARKKLHINPYASSDWTSDCVLKVETKVQTKAGHDDFQFQPNSGK